MTPAPPPSAAEPAWTDLDSASGRPLHPAAREAMLAAYDAGYADVRRLHHAGRRARAVLDNAREVVAESLQVRPDEVTFTGSGTEAVHRGLLGLVRGRRREGSVVVRSAVEHSAVLHAADFAERESGTTSDAVVVDPTGRVDLDALAGRLAAHAAPGGPGTALVALQSANHEVGTRQPVEQAAAIAAGHGVPLLVDACASVGWEPLPTGWAVATASAHKWGGPSGVGVLLVRKHARWRDPSPADDRGDRRAVGFESAPGALAAAAALQATLAESDRTARRVAALVDRVRGEVARTVPEVDVVGDPTDRLPHLLTFSCLYVDGEALVSVLDREGFGVGSGSACTASTHEPSHVLAAMGALTQGNVRISLHPGTTEAEVDRFLAVLPRVVRDLRAEIGA
ncbi:aminotransferase class V-fold PLP-dependent enzyme [Nocardioides zeae]|uniref:Aminotransferase class V-fold PLP-dependent enzyme n=1 Tax=Nocardioides imazamoxiresistens TaxID=3231893 RepID=A0ABU3PX61_9ACTN|nr:aminotransferase class V-fold PLP-dependent enzyme [Nocardioides zeae]MDT9593816.1 aminotransferase class V-fold PLP-dependent enzyme [Nocardioides zeae]